MSNWNKVFKPIVVLCVICIVITGALAATNSATAPRYIGKVTGPSSKTQSSPCHARKSRQTSSSASSKVVSLRVTEHRPLWRFMWDLL